jgi:radical SAM superfamily enzyme YgiQ (UPF0313 family)
MRTFDDELDVVLMSTYDLGHQPFGLASAAAWLRGAGARVVCRDLAVEDFDEAEIAAAGMVAVHVPMHTATRKATPLVDRIRRINPDAHMCFFGLYAPVNEGFLRGLGVATVLGGECEANLVRVYERIREAHRPGRVPGPQVEPVMSWDRLDFQTPDRRGLPELTQYAHLSVGGQRRTAGYTEATRGCKHTCRHCPVVPVYGGRFRVVPRDVVMADIRQQVAAGAEHISFGDPDFFNAPTHALRLVRQLHEEFPGVTYDVVIKVEHLLARAKDLATLRDTGCLFVTSAVESVDDEILERLDKRHTSADFAAAAGVLREVGLTLSPTFVAFTPWTSLEGYLALLDAVCDLDLVDAVAPVQYAIRLLIPAGSLLLGLKDVQALVEPFDPEALVFPWKHPDPAVDALAREVMSTVAAASQVNASRRETFLRIRELVYRHAGKPVSVDEVAGIVGCCDSAVPRMSEPWYCCAEPMAEI